MEGKLSDHSLNSSFLASSPPGVNQYPQMATPFFHTHLSLTKNPNLLYVALKKRIVNFCALQLIYFNLKVTHCTSSFRLSLQLPY